MAAHKRFIILGQPRTGTTLVVSLLNSHPAITCDGEILNPELRYFNRNILRLSRWFPDPFFLNRRHRGGTSVYGCKLLVYQLKWFESALLRLHRQGWSVVHVTRKDVLRSAFSDAIARAMKYWHRRRSEPVPGYRVDIPPRVIMAQLDKREAWSRLETRVLDRIPHTRLCYEDDLIKPEFWQAGIERVLTFLNIPSGPVSSDLVPTDDRKLREIVSNLDAIIPMIADSKWSAALDWLKTD